MEKKSSFRIDIFGFRVRNAKDIGLAIVEYKRRGLDKKNVAPLWYFIGLYESRKFGLCIYRPHKDIEYDKNVKY